jgi:hypothetical protein
MTTTLYALTFDCTNAGRLAQFWADVLRRNVDPDASAEMQGNARRGDHASSGPGR